MTNTYPANHQEHADVEPHLVLEPTVVDERSGARYVHKDYEVTVDPWEHEQHISPPSADEAFGDVESWAEYVTRYSLYDSAVEPLSFVTWNSKGLRAVLDYHERGGSAPGRCQWIARLPFESSVEWQAWAALANGAAHPQALAVEKLEALRQDIHQPEPTELMNLLRNLRANSNASADVELRPDGTARVSYNTDDTVRSSRAQGQDLPSEIEIRIPILRGDTMVNDEGRTVPALTQVKVRLFASVHEGKLGLRFAIQNSERILETVYLERVDKARELLVGSYRIYRAAG